MRVETTLLGVKSLDWALENPMLAIQPNLFFAQPVVVRLNAFLLIAV